MKITEHRYRHWERLTATPNLVVFMNARIADAVAFIRPYDQPGLPFDVLLSMLAYANQLDSRYYEINTVLLAWPRDASDRM